MLDVKKQFMQIPKDRYTTIKYFITAFVCNMLFMVVNTSFANHNKGGSITYICNGPGQTANTLNYTFTITHYIDCSQLTRETTRKYATMGIYIGKTNTVYNNSNYTKIQVYPLNTNPIKVDNPNLDPCITNAPDVCYYYRDYQVSMDLPISTTGYTVIDQDGTRTENLANIPNSKNYSWTFDTYIPPTIINSSPVFSAKNMAGVICHNAPLSIDLSAEDPDGDALEYEFSPALDGVYTYDKDKVVSVNISRATALSYASGYSGTAPMGATVTLDRQTGLMSGIAPSETGAFNIAYYVIERRNGVEIARTKREILFSVADCSLKAIELNPTYINCDGYDFTFQNENSLAEDYKYTWDFGDGETSVEESPKHTYSSAGEYTLTLKAENPLGCSDEESSTIKVYPGFYPDFTFSPQTICEGGTATLQDATTANYGTVNAWKWTFDDNTSASGKSISHDYLAAGEKAVTLSVSSDRGCTKEITKKIPITAKPKITLPYSSKTICAGYASQIGLSAEDGISYSWTPATGISNPQIANPTFILTDSTTYTLTIEKDGCENSYPLTINVIPNIDIEITASSDKICIGDSVIATAATNGTSVRWASSNDNKEIENPEELKTLIWPKSENNIYTLTASIDACSAEKTLEVYASAYPTVEAGSNISVCSGDSVQITGISDAQYLSWENASGKIIGNGLKSPYIKPNSDTYYKFSGYNNDYCGKTVSDIVEIHAVPAIYIYAAKDTNANAGQPIILQAAANNADLKYLWSPAQYFTQNNSATATAVFPANGYYDIYITGSTPEGCEASSQMKVKVFGNEDHVYIPSAFTPNNDGKNDKLIPITSGIVQIDRFMIFNRLGQCVYQSKSLTDGWDGNIKGKLAEPGTYVYTFSAKTADGHEISQKGFVVLIR